MAVPTGSTKLDRLAELFRQYEDIAFPASGADLYAPIAGAIADDRDLLEMASGTRPGQPGPNLLFGAVHYLLLAGADHPLAGYYPDVTGDPARRPIPYAPFRDFCMTHREKIVALVGTRLVQTNVIERSCALAPAFAVAAARYSDNPLAIVEIGCSAALNMLWDRYHYDYGDGTAWGDAASPVRLQSELRGETPLPQFGARLNVGWRTGIDLDPVDLNDDDAVLWQRALIWPERIERQERLSAAIPIVRAGAPRLLAGDACDLLPGVLEEAPAEMTLCVYATYALYQFPHSARSRLYDILREHSRRRDVGLVTLDSEDASGDGALRLTVFHRRNQDSTLLARCHPHGRWIAWLPA